MIFRSAAIELPAVAFHPLTSIPAQSFIRRRRHLNDYINSEHLPATRHYRCALYIIILYSRRSRVRCRPVVYRSSPAPRRHFPPSPGTRRTRTKREKRFLVTCYFIRLGKETHTRRGVRVQIDLSLYMLLGTLSTFFSLTFFFFWLPVCSVKTSRTTARCATFCFN